MNETPEVRHQIVRRLREDEPLLSRLRRKLPTTFLIQFGFVYRYGCRRAIVLSLSVLALFNVLSPVTFRCLIADERDAVAPAGLLVNVFAVRSGDALARTDMLRGILGPGTSLASPLRIAADLRTKSIIAVGVVEDLEVIRGILTRLDDPAAFRSQTVQAPLANLNSKQERSRPNRPDFQDKLGHPASKSDQPLSSDSKVRATGASAQKIRHDGQSMPFDQDLQNASQQFMVAKAELDGLNERYSKTPTVFSSSELAKASSPCDAPRFELKS